MVDKRSQRIICTALPNGKRHDFRLFKESKTYIHPQTKVITDSGYQGIQRIHRNSQLPKKKTKKNPCPKKTKEIIRNFPANAFFSLPVTFNNVLRDKGK